MNTPQAERVFVVLGALLAGYQLIAVAYAVGFGLFDSDAADAWWLGALANAAGVAFIVSGLRQRAQTPLRAGILVAIGVLPSILMFWMIIPPIVALGVATYAVLNGRNRQRQLRAGT